MIAECKTCGKEYKTSPCKILKHGRKFCSKDCYYVYRKEFRHTKETKEKMSIAHTGENNASWKGGVFFKKRGYGSGFNRRNRRENKRIIRVIRAKLGEAAGGFEMLRRGRLADRRVKVLP